MTAVGASRFGPAYVLALAFGLLSQVEVIRGDQPATTGTIVFEGPTPVAVGPSPRTIAMVDIGGDGLTDLIVGNVGTCTSTCVGTVAVLSGNGDGTLQTPVYYTSGWSPSHLVLADFNNDGRTDIAAVNGPDSPTTADVYVYLNNGDGTLRPGIRTALSLAPGNLVAADFDLDGKQDLLVGYSASLTFSVMLKGNGNGTFGPPVKLEWGFPGFRQIGADFNRDGKPDFAMQRTPGVMILLGQGTLTGFTPAGLYSVSSGQAVSGFALGDFNTDGIPDIAASLTQNVSRTGPVGAVMLGNGDGTVTGPVLLTSEPKDAGRSVAVADFNLDGKDDVAISLEDLHHIAVFRGLGNGQFATPLLVPAGLFCRALAAGDLNRDGRPDLVACRPLHHNVSVLINVTPLPASGRNWEFLE